MDTGAPAPAPVPPYADSLDSLSPRSRGGDSWDDTLPLPPATAAAPKLRLMCSYGGHIVPRPHDKALCYLGGETRLVAVDRHFSLADLQARLSRSLIAGRSFSLKYQLPSEDLDSLISVSSDEDLDNMLDEYDRAAAASGASRPSRLRLFLFPATPDPPPPSASSSSSKSDTWFVDALNAAGPLKHSSADSAASSIDCLLGLGGSVEADAGQMPGKPGRHCAQDVQSMPDSPMLETTSSFGSASSAPSLSSLPPIRVQPEEERAADPRGAIDATGLEERLAQMNVSGQQQKPSPVPLDVEGFNHHLHHFPLPPPLPTSTNPTSLVAAEETPFPTENPKPSSSVSSSDEKSHQEGIWRSPPLLSQQQQLYQQQPQQQQLLENSNFLDVPMSGDAISRSVYCQERPSLASGPKRQEAPFSDPGYQFPVHVTEQGYLVHQPSLQPLQQQAHQQQQNVIPHLAAHHHATGTVLPIPSFYNQMLIHPQQQLPQAATHAYPPQVPLYFLPVHHGSAYSLPVQPKLGDAAIATAPVPATSKPTIPSLSSLLLPPHVAPAHKQEAPTNVYRTGVGAAPVLSQPPHPTKLIHLDQSQQYVGYHPLQQPTSQSAAPTPVAASFGYEYADAVHGYQMYYTPPSSAALPAQYQMMSAGAVQVEQPLALQQPTDAKQSNAS